MDRDEEFILDDGYLESMRDEREFEDELLAEKAYRRAYFPNLAPGVPARESDEYPTMREED